ncbi:probable serine/threonine-protein kinase DDB_G0282963 isoform X2 [Chelonus insularis]|nr:probable serine/threonine-protein kinase DDB_G0282963 isoform X2 [Chelonus insularis]XP_034938765.1 probable serine/threonine-protein kinase DDB_G0282963 isoform X2 [Chelonus insularis]
MNLGLLSTTIPIINPTKMALFFGASIAVGMIYSFVPWLYEDPEESIEENDNDFNIHITQESNAHNEETLSSSSSSTEIRIITHQRQRIRVEPEDEEVHQTSIRSKINSENSTSFLCINFPLNVHCNTLPEIKLLPTMKKDFNNNQHPSRAGIQTDKYLTYRNNSSFQESCQLDSNYKTLVNDEKNAGIDDIPRQKISKPPRAHPPSRGKSLSKSDECLSSSKKSFVNAQTQTFDTNHHQVQSSLNLNHPELAQKISKLKESSQSTDVDQSHKHPLDPLINVIVCESESSIFPSSSHIDHEVDSSSKNSKNVKNINNTENKINNNESVPKKALRKKHVKFREHNFSSSSEFYENSFKQYCNNRKSASSSFVSGIKRALSFNKSEKDLMKSKSSISSATGRIPSGHSTPIERSSISSEEHQGYLDDALRNESKQKHELNQSGNLSRRPKVLLLTRGIPSCLIQDLNLIHEKSNSKFLTSSTISETSTSSENSKNQTQRGKNVGIETSNFTTTGSNSNDTNDNHSNYNSGWISRLSRDMHQVIGGIRKYIKVPKLNGNFQPSNRYSVNKDINNNNYYYNDNNSHNHNNKYNNESSLKCSSWKFKSSSTLNKTHSLTFLKTDIDSEENYCGLSELRDKKLFTRWSNLIFC